MREGGGRERVRLRERERESVRECVYLPLVINGMFTLPLAIEIMTVINFTPGSKFTGAWVSCTWG